MMESSVRTEDQRAAARRTLTALLITVVALFVGSVVFMSIRNSGQRHCSRYVSQLGHNDSCVGAVARLHVRDDQSQVPRARSP